MITGLNLSLSNRCTATCVWCPDTRGTRNQMDMPFETAKKVIDEVADNYPWQLQTMELGENGEALLNKDALKILRYVKERLPCVRTEMANNFALMNEATARAILSENLLTRIHLNIDGHDAETYKAVKGLNYNVVMRNFKKFLEIHAELNSPMEVAMSVVTLYEYMLAVRLAFGPTVKPHNLRANFSTSTFQEVEAQLRTFVPDNIVITQSAPGLWAERANHEHINRDMFPIEGRQCPIINRVTSEAFIAPNGDWYPCCLDDNQDIVLGNVNEQTLLEIYHSEKRNTFVKQLWAREFDEIGYPCNTVECCWQVKLPEDVHNNYVPGSKIIWMKQS